MYIKNKNSRVCVEVLNDRNCIQINGEKKRSSTNIKKRGRETCDCP